MADYCLLCLLAVMQPPEPAPVPAGGLDLHAAVMHLVRQERPQTTPEQRREILESVPDYLGGPDLTHALEQLKR